MKEVFSDKMRWRKGDKSYFVDTSYIKYCYKITASGKGRYY